MLRLPGLHTNPLQIQTLLFPPPYFHPCPWPPFRRQTQVHNGPSCNILRYCVLVTGDISVRLLQPCLCHHILHRGLNSSRLGICSLPDQYTSHMRPLLSGVPEVAHHLRPFVFLCRKNSPHILEGGYLGEGDTICSDSPIIPLLCLLLHQAMTLPLNSLSEIFLSTVFPLLALASTSPPDTGP